MASRNTRLGLRITPNQDSLIRAAAARRGLSITDFVLESACARAEADILERSVFVVPSKAFDKLMADAETPPRALKNAKSRFARLARHGVRDHA